MSQLKDVITSYNNRSFSDRIVFYTTISNDITVSDNMQSFLIETRLDGEGSCLYCEGTHVVKNGRRKDGIQRFLCRDCRKSFIANSDSITARTRKSVTVWAAYLRCMMDQKTLKRSSEECHISMSTAFTWRHKILDTLRELTEKVCVPCAVNDTGISYAKPGKLGKISSACITSTFEEKIAPRSVLCTDKGRAYLDLAGTNDLELVQMDTDCRTSAKEGEDYGIQRINAYHSRLKLFIRRFHGVSTKHLGNYIVWNDLLFGNHRNRDTFFAQLWGQLLCARITRYWQDIPRRPPLPVVA
jgi:transposase-like protein